MIWRVAAVAIFLVSVGASHCFAADQKGEFYDQLFRQDGSWTRFLSKNPGLAIRLGIDESYVPGLDRAVGNLFPPAVSENSSVADQALQLRSLLDQIISHAVERNNAILGEPRSSRAVQYNRRDLRSLYLVLPPDLRMKLQPNLQRAEAAWRQSQGWNERVARAMAPEYQRWEEALPYPFLSVRCKELCFRLVPYEPWHFTYTREHHIVVHVELRGDVGAFRITSPEKVRSNQGTEHSHERAPLLVYWRGRKPSERLDDGHTLAIGRDRFEPSPMSRMISKLHVSVTRSGDKIAIEDVGSIWGTTIRLVKPDDPGRPALHPGPHRSPRP